MMRRWAGRRSPRVWLLVLMMVCALGGLPDAASAQMEPLTDAQLDRVAADGVSLYLDLDFGLSPHALPGAASTLSAGTVLPQSEGAGAADSTHLVGTVNQLSLTDIRQTFNVGGNALQYSQSLLNVFVNGGDVGIGVNLTVIIDGNNSTFNISNTNANFVRLGGVQ